MKTKYSNCLFEALKAKIKDPKHIRIIRFPKVLTGHLHFGWTDGEYFYHSYDPIYNKRSRIGKKLTFFLYRIRTKKVPYLVFQSYWVDHLRCEPLDIQKKVIKKYCPRFASIPGVFPDEGWQWGGYGKNDTLPKEEDVRYMEKLFRGTVFIKVSKTNEYIKTMKYEELLEFAKNQDEDSFWRWRYVTVMDTPDFEGLYDTYLRVRAKEIEPHGYEENDDK